MEEGFKLSLQNFAADHGLRHGVTISAYCDGSSMAGVSLTSRDDDHAFELLLKERLRAAQQISRLFNDHLFRKPECQAIFLMPVLKRLSETEVSVLAGLSQGRNIKRIAYDLRISERYVNNTVISKLKIKFGQIATLLHFDDSLVAP